MNTPAKFTNITQRDEFFQHVARHQRSQKALGNGYSRIDITTLFNF